MVRQRAHDDSVVMVKNEEIVASSVSGLEYQALMQSDGGKMGGAVTGWLRIGRGGVHGLAAFSKSAADRVFTRIVGVDPLTLDKQARAEADRVLGVMSFTCDPTGLQGLLEENVRLALLEMDGRLGGDAEAEAALREGGLVLLAVVAWGAAPAQRGGRAAERKYTDLIVHLTPASDFWDSETLAFEIVPPRTARASLVSRGGAPSAVASPQPEGVREYGERAEVDEAGRLGAPTQSTLAVRRGAVLTVPESASTDAVLLEALRLAELLCKVKVVRADLDTTDLHEWDEVLLIGPSSLCASAAFVDVRGGVRWERAADDSGGGMIAPRLSAALREAVDAGGS